MSDESIKLDAPAYKKDDDGYAASRSEKTHLPLTRHNAVSFVFPLFFSTMPRLRATLFSNKFKYPRSQLLTQVLAYMVREKCDEPPPFRRRRDDFSKSARLKIAFHLKEKRREKWHEKLEFDRLHSNSYNVRREYKGYYSLHFLQIKINII